MGTLFFFLIPDSKAVLHFYSVSRFSSFVADYFTLKFSIELSLLIWICSLNIFVSVSAEIIKKGVLFSFTGSY